MKAAHGPSYRFPRLAMQPAPPPGVTTLSFASERKPVALVLGHGPIHTRKATRWPHEHAG